MIDPAADGLMPFHAMEILSRAKLIEATGKPVFHLEVGEPGSPPAPAVLEAVAKALPQAQGYTHAKGMRELREAISGYYILQHGMVVNPDNIICTMGSSSGFILAFHAAFKPGARIAVTRPGYPAYVNTLIGLGFGVAEIPVSAANGWRLTGADIAAAHARQPFDGLLFASPANPTGASVDQAGLADIIDTCARLDIKFISDEIYHGLDYRGRSVSAVELSDEAIVINSFSKYYCMTGWRIGWMVLPEKFIRRAEILQQNFFISAPTLSQIAASVAIHQRDYAEEQKAGYAQNRLLLDDGLRSLGLELSGPSDGAFYAYADISEFSDDSLKLCESLLEQTGVAVTPGVDFDRVDGHKFIRLSYAGKRETIEMALERMGRFLAKR